MKLSKIKILPNSQGTKQTREWTVSISVHHLNYNHILKLKYDFRNNKK